MSECRICCYRLKLALNKVGKPVSFEFFQMSYLAIVTLEGIPTLFTPIPFSLFFILCVTMWRGLIKTISKTILVLVPIGLYGVIFERPNNSNVLWIKLVWCSILDFIICCKVSRPDSLHTNICTLGEEHYQSTTHHTAGSASWHKMCITCAKFFSAKSHNREV